MKNLTVVKLPKFLFSQNQSAIPGAELILCTESPFFYGQVMTGFSMKQILNISSQMEMNCGSTMFDYKVAIILVGALHSSLVVGDLEKHAKDLSCLAREMSEFYFEEKMKPNLKYYERFRESVSYKEE